MVFKLQLPYLLFSSKFCYPLQNGKVIVVDASPLQIHYPFSRIFQKRVALSFFSFKFWASVLHMVWKLFGSEDNEFILEGFKID